MKKKQKKIRFDPVSLVAPPSESQANQEEETFGYQLPRKNDQRKSPPKFRAVIIAISLITVIVLVFWLKNIYEQKKSADSLANKFQADQEEEVELSKEVKIVSASEVRNALDNRDFQLVDLREPNEFALLHIETSVNLPFSQIERNINFIDDSKKVVLIDREEMNRTKKLANHLAKEGVETRYFKGGIVEYANEGYPFVNLGDPFSALDNAKVTSVTAKELKERIDNGERFKLLDVRPNAEFQSDRINNSINIPLEDLERRKREIPISKIVVYDSDPVRAFRAAVRLYDMNVIGVYACKDEYEVMAEELVGE